VLGEVTMLSNGTTVQYCDISHAENTIWLEGSNCKILNNYLHDPFASAGAHIDGIQVPNGANVQNLLLQYNNIYLNTTNTTSCLMFSDVHNSTIDSNQMYGGAYVMYFEDGSSGNSVTNNQIPGWTFGPLYQGDPAWANQNYSNNTYGSSTGT